MRQNLWIWRTWILMLLIVKVERPLSFCLTNPECWLKDGAWLVRIDWCDWWECQRGLGSFWSSKGFVGTWRLKGYWGQRSQWKGRAPRGGRCHRQRSENRCRCHRIAFKLRVAEEQSKVLAVNFLDPEFSFGIWVAMNIQVLLSTAWTVAQIYLTWLALVRPQATRLESSATQATSSEFA